MSHRIFIGLTEVAGYFGNLHEGFRRIGVPSTLIDESAHPFQYRRPSRYSRLAAKLNVVVAGNRDRAERTGALHWRFAATVARLCRVLVRGGLFAWAGATHDVFIFGGEESLIPRHLDLPILRLLRKRIVWVFTGSDHRPPYLNGRAVRAAGPTGGSALVAETARTRSRIAVAERHALAVVAFPASAQLHRRPFVDFARIGIPVEVEPPRKANSGGGFRGHGIRVLHSPSDPVSKGSVHIRECIKILRSQGQDLDYQEVTGRPHHEVMDALGNCDFLVDEVYSDTPMGMLAAEAAQLGKPTVVGGYYASTVTQQFPPHLVPPSEFCEPEHLCDAIAVMASNREYRVRLGARAQVFVRQHWSIDAVARRYLALIDGSAPREWWVDPGSVRYAHGWGLSEAAVGQAVRMVVEVAGETGLLLDHNPSLRRRLVDLADTARRLSSVQDG